MRVDPLDDWRVRGYKRKKLSRQHWGDQRIDQAWIDSNLTGSPQKAREQEDHCNTWAHQRRTSNQQDRNYNSKRVST